MTKPVTRYFNHIEKNKVSVIKTSACASKLIDEINWYRDIPKDLKHYLPTIIDSNLSEPFLQMNNCGSDFATLLCTNKQVDFENYFEQILKCIKDLHSHKHTYPLSKQLQGRMYKNKTIDRVIEYNNNENLSIFFKDIKVNGKLLPGINHLLENLNHLTKKLTTDDWSIVHGDLHLGNIIQNNDRIKLIDPRGSFGGYKTIYGDPAYDWAKLFHDIYYNFSFISHLKFDLTEDFNYNIKVNKKQNINKQLMLEMFVNKCPYDIKTMDLISALLFISMIPLHNEDVNKQKMLIIKGLEAYKNAIC